MPEYCTTTLSQIVMERAVIFTYLIQSEYDINALFVKSIVILLAVYSINWRKENKI
jgi:hypothetical protein